MTSTDPYPIRTIFRRFFPEYRKSHSLSEEQRRAACSIIRCKTGELGYTISYCEDCGHPLIHAVSCNNRSCPCCQAPLEKKWELERNTELIEGIAYFHVVFTVPHELNALIRHNQKLLLDLQFRCVQDTLLTLCADPRFMGAKPGILSVLHTWGQKLSFHPHIHVCISGGGITPAGQFVETKHKGFFLPAKTMAAMFRGKYLYALKKLYDKGVLDCSHIEELQDPFCWKAFIDALFRKTWIPFVGETFNGRGNAIRYLARYAFRTAISNSRIVSVTDTHVTFRYKDYADNSRQKTLTVRGVDFIGLFLQHILPKGFSRTRFSGYLTNCRKTKNLQLIHACRGTVFPGNPYRRMNTAQLMMALYHKDICTCPECSGHMIRLPRGMPASMLPPQLRGFLNAVC
jgi:hypothetical protein